jgi:hypothetical protein
MIFRSSNRSDGEYQSDLRFSSACGHSACVVLLANDVEADAWKPQSCGKKTTAHFAFLFASVFAPLCG